MNTVDSLISEARRYGSELMVIDGRLKAVPSGRLPAHLKAELRRAAAEIKAQLARTATEAALPTTDELFDQRPLISFGQLIKLVETTFEGSGYLGIKARGWDAKQ
jgi:hypothetical protein